MIWSRFARLALFLVPMLATGCTIHPIKPFSHACTFTRYNLEVEDPTSHPDAASFGSLVVSKVLRRPPGDSATPNPSMLFLSGGSLHGAFGAGFLDAWKTMGDRKRSPSTSEQEAKAKAALPDYPDFRVVTGISTGSILSTFAFVGATDLAVKGYTIDAESDLLKPFGSVKNGEPGVDAYLKLLQKGALADLSPLRDRLKSYMDDAMLRKVAAEGGRGRLLLIGVVDVDTGKAVVLDLTQMAQQYVEASSETGRIAKRECYVEGIIASSSSPLAALPVFIDDRMYIDGGARFGMFTDEIGRKIEDLPPVAGDSQARPTIYLLINGNQEMGPKCGRVDASKCPKGSDPPGTDVGDHADWSFLGLALRSENILANQVYRFSADAVAKRADAKKMGFQLFKIEDDLPGHRYPRDATTGLPMPDSKTCSEWHDVDRAHGDPLQFYPQYMRCVIDYGRVKAQARLVASPSTPGPTRPGNGPF